MNSVALYETDFYAWTLRHAQLLRDGRLDELDIEHLAEEIESVGSSERRQLQHRLEVLIAHLLKLHFLEQWREENQRGWQLTIKEQRRKIALCLRQNPSLTSQLPVFLEEVYPTAVYLVVLAFKLDEADFPATCPYTLEEILSDDFIPIQ